MAKMSGLSFRVVARPLAALFVLSTVSACAMTNDVGHHVSALICEDNPFENQGFVSTMSITSSYLAESLRHYKQGVKEADQALSGRNTLTQNFMRQITVSDRDIGISSGFNNFAVLEESDEVVRQLDVKIDQQMNDGLDDVTKSRLRGASKSLYIANYYQIRVIFRIYKASSYLFAVKDMSDVVLMLEKEGVNETFVALIQTPANFRTLAKSVNNATGVCNRLREVSNFSTETAALQELGINDDIKLFENRVIAQAKASDKNYPALVGLEPSGGVLGELLGEYAGLGETVSDAAAKVYCSAVHGTPV